MVQTHFTFNVIIYAIVIAYILYINIAAYTNKSTGFLNFLIGLFQNWIFRVIFLLVIGYFALDLLPYGGFVLAVLLTIAFLNTNMLMYKRNVGEAYNDYVDDGIENFDDDEIENFDDEIENFEDDDIENFEDDDVENFEDSDVENFEDDDVENFEDDDVENFEDDVENFEDNISENFENLDGDDVENYENIENLKDQGAEYDQALMDVYNAVEKKEKFSNKKQSKRGDCGPYAPLMRLPFNPQGYRPDESVLSSGAPDVLPPNSRGNGEYTDSGVAYEFDMA